MSIIIALLFVVIIATLKGIEVVDEARDRQNDRFSSRTVADYEKLKGCAE